MRPGRTVLSHERCRDDPAEEVRLCVASSFLEALAAIPNWIYAATAP
jgi:hypothetical protein